MEGLIIWVVIALVLRALTGGGGPAGRRRGRPGWPGPGEEDAAGGGGSSPDVLEQLRREWQRQLEEAGAPRRRRRGPATVGRTARPLAGERAALSEAAGDEEGPGPGLRWMAGDQPEEALGGERPRAGAEAGAGPIRLTEASPGPAVATALAALHDDRAGAGTAIVLAEILGPPRFRSAWRPSAPAARWGAMRARTGGASTSGPSNRGPSSGGASNPA